VTVGNKKTDWLIQDLRLRDDVREIVYKGNLSRRGGPASENGNLLVFLFDHALLMVKPKAKYDQYKVFRKVPTLSAR
jgi:hypothetical protein